MPPYSAVAIFGGITEKFVAERAGYSYFSSLCSLGFQRKAAGQSIRHVIASGMSKFFGLDIPQNLISFHHSLPNSDYVILVRLINVLTPNISHTR